MDISIWHWFPGCIDKPLLLKGHKYQLCLFREGLRFMKTQTQAVVEPLEPRRTIKGSFTGPYRVLCCQHIAVCR